MCKIVEEGYESGDYAATFRAPDTLPAIAVSFFDQFAKLLPRGCRVLDLGCGPGVPFDKRLAEDGFAVTGVDISRKHVGIARGQVPDATFVAGDFSAMDFDEQSFDGILSLYAIFHIPRAEHEALFAKMRRWLKPRGTLLLCLGARNFAYDEEEGWCGATKMAWSSFTGPGYERMIRELGFSILRTEYEGSAEEVEHHFWLLASAS